MREFERPNLQKFKCPGFARGGGGGVFKFRVDRRIIFFDLPISLCWMDMVVVHILSTAVDSIKEQRPKILFLFLSDQGWTLIII